MGEPFFTSGNDGELAEGTVLSDGANGKHGISSEVPADAAECVAAQAAVD